MMDIYAPFGMDAFAKEATQAVDNATAVSPTAATVQPTGDIPAKAMLVTVEDQPARFYVDGSTPTAALGHSVPAESSFVIFGVNNIKNFAIIAESTNIALTMTYYR